ncbi:glutamate receptor 2.7-like [Bidens hawaiensis]|uniref:glutamate receptor 2.7-like n=1 Tax=Bidens hawaiensis TaxID=980011 RepID=UPI0040495627
MQNITRDTSAVGVILDMTSRVGKEARVAIEIAIDDFNTEMKTNLSLYTRNSHGNVVQAIRDATNLIDIHKVDAILGLQTLEEVVSVGKIVSIARIPTLSLLDSVPQCALDSFSFLVQATHSNQFAQMKAFVAILKSCDWNCFTFIYEDINSASTQVIPHLLEAIKESDVHMSSIVRLSSVSSSSSLLEELGRINTMQCRVFLVHVSLEMGIHLFQNAKSMGMMGRGYVWITTNLVTDLLHTVNSSTFSIMEGVVGLGSFFQESCSQFYDFNTKFQKRFKIEQPEEESNIPGIFAVRAYDATLTMALALSRKNMSGQKLLDVVSSISLTAITSKVQFINRKSNASIFQIINVIGTYYRQLGFWSEGLGFSEVIDDGATNDTSLQNLGNIFWPGKPLHTPRGWAIPTNANPLRVGVPTMAVFKKFVDVKYDDWDHNYTFTGYSVELFKETVKRLPYYLPYEFHPFNGTYDLLVEQVYHKNFDAVVGDVSVVSRRYQFAEFTHPFTETGLMMVVASTSYHQQWLFVKPFTSEMWVITILFNIYNALVIYLIERKHNPELQGSVLNQTGILLYLAFTRMFSRDRDEEVHSNLTRMTTVAWLFAAIIIGQCYTASLTSMLTIRRLTPQVTDYQTLRNTNAVVGYSKGSHVARYLHDVLGFKNENLRNFTSQEEYAHALRSRQIAAVFLETPLAKLFISKYCKSFTTAGPTFRDGGFAFVLPKGSPMVHDFTKALLNVSESGTLQDIEKRMLGSEQCVDQDTIHDEYGSLDLSAFSSLFFLTGGTSTVALATYVIISLRKYYQMEGKSLVVIISDIKKYIAHRRKRLSRKVSDLESPKALEVTCVGKL